MSPRSREAELWVGKPAKRFYGRRQPVERVGGGRDMPAALQRRDQLGKHPPRRPRHSRRGLRLEVALHAPVPVHERPFLLRHVRDAEVVLPIANVAEEEGTFAIGSTTSASRARSGSTVPT